MTSNLSTTKRWTQEQEAQLLANPKEPIEGRSVGACRIRLLKILNRKLDAGEMTHEEIREKYNVSEEQLDKDREITNRKFKSCDNPKDIMEQLKKVREVVDNIIKMNS